MTTLPDSNGLDTPEQRYARSVRAYNVAVSRYNSALKTFKWAKSEFADAESWYDQTRDEFNRAAAAIGLKGAA